MSGFFNQRTIRGFLLGECISALQKAIRRGDEAAAIAFAVELDQSGHSVLLWNRLLIIGSEDVGLAEMNLPANLRALHENWQDIKARNNPKLPERLFVMHAVLMLVRARKSRLVDNAIWASYAVEEPLVKEMPAYALDRHTGHGPKNGAGRPDQASYAITNAADLGPNPYFDRKEAYRDEVGWEKSKEWFDKQGKRPARSPEKP